ncbi:DEAD/DEAH box helicase [Caulobacter sp. SL161]|uniref:ATP-dependent helicase n=1 Tax=Caulobacter vibrioides TaxID=155892 RepID=A0A290MW84_CAUVI|nr:MULTISPECIES: DEAD/DEAH box helicase [Caulobacter]ATC34153.1 ATP-dependent helicase [Caulobacter vibrioides]MCY1649089.1 DEAD/DEAH box helicase [Caulobacter sp. SL161]
MRTYGKLARAGECWVLEDVEPHVAIKLKAIFPSVPKASAGPFKLPANEATSADVSWFLQRYPLQASAGDLAELERRRTAFVRVQDEMAAILAPDYQPTLLAGLRPGQEIRAHQARAIEMVRRFGGVLVGDEMGLGKTYTGGGACLLPGALPATVVCPTHLRGQWAQKLREFTTLEPHVISTTKPYPLPPCDVRVFSYTQLQGWADVLDMLGTGLVIFDEAHELRHGTDTQKGVAALRLAEASAMRMVMTGTPVFNYGNEIWRIMQYCRPEVLGEYEDFAREWCGSGREVQDPEALGTYLREQHAMIRKVSPGPKPNIIVQTIDHEVEALERVEHLAHALAIRASTGTFEERGQAVRELDMMMRLNTGVAKAKAVAKYARIVAEAGEPLILLGWHRDVYDIWLSELSDLNPVMYTGTETPARKEEAKRRFLAGESDIFIMSLRSGAGLDGLQARAKVTIFGELDWSPQMHAQCIGRLNREGQACWPEPVTAIFLVAVDGSDPPMMDVNGLKASQAHGIVDPGEERIVTRDVSKLQSLVQRYLNRSEAA